MEDKVPGVSELHLNYTDFTDQDLHILHIYFHVRPNHQGVSLLRNRRDVGVIPVHYGTRFGSNDARSSIVSARAEVTEAPPLIVQLENSMVAGRYTSSRSAASWYGLYHPRWPKTSKQC